MSKKLIAVASAAVLALSAIVVMPTAANATTFSVTPTGAATNSVDRNGSTSAKSQQINVPTNDVLRFVAGGNSVATITDGTVIKLTVATPNAADPITITTTGGVKVITDTVFDTGDATSATASTSTDTAATNSAVLYAFTTTTAGGTAVISAAGSSQTIFISGLSTFAYKMDFSSSATAGVAGKFTLTGTVKDAFGNDLTTELAAADLEITILGGSAALAKEAVAAGSSAKSTYAYNKTTKVYTVTGNMRDSAGSQAISLNVVAAKAATKVTAFGDPITNQFFTVTAADLATQVTQLQAQIADMRTKANSVTKKRWNKLVRAHRALGGKAKLK